MTNATKKCPMCAEQIPIDAAVCPYCGTPWGSESIPPAVPASTAQVSQPPLQAAPPPPKKNAWIGWVIGGGILICLVVLVGVGFLVAQRGFSLPGIFAPATPTRTPWHTPITNYAPTVQQPSSSTLPAQDISVYCGYFNYSPVYINDGQPVSLQWKWGTTSDEYTQDYINAASFSLIMDGQEMEVSSADRNLDPCYDGPCVTWRLPALVLDKGEHKVEMTVNLDREITDGYDLDGNGVLDTYGPGEQTSPPCMIVVNPYNDIYDWVDNFAAPIVTDISDNDLPPNAEDSFDDPGRSYADWPFISSGVSFTDGNMHFVSSNTEEFAGGAINAVNFLAAFQFVPRVIGEETWMAFTFRGSETTWYDIGIRPNDGYWDIAIRREDGNYDVLSEGSVNPIQVDQEVDVVIVVQGNMMGFFIDTQNAGYANNFELSGDWTTSDWVDFKVYSADYGVVDVQFVKLWDLNNLLR